MLSHKEIEKFHSVAQAIKVEEGVRMYKIVSSCFRFSFTLKSNPLHLTSTEMASEVIEAKNGKPSAISRFVIF